jgi:hypothetical protein
MPTPEQDPYDPAKPEYIKPATAREIVEEDAKQRRRQINRLETALRNGDGHRSTKPGILRRYRQHLLELHPGRRGKPGVLRDARDAPMPPTEQKPQGGPPVHSLPSGVTLLTAAQRQTVSDGSDPKRFSTECSPRPWIALPRTSSAPALAPAADTDSGSELRSFRTSGSIASMP